MVENTIASQLKRLRKSRGWTKTQLADKLSVSKQTISNWETGTKVPRMGSLQNLADLFHVKIGEITNASIIKQETQSHLPTNIFYPLGDDFERISIPLIGEIAFWNRLFKNFFNVALNIFLGCDRIPTGNFTNEGDAHALKIIPQRVDDISW